MSLPRDTIIFDPFHIGREKRRGLLRCNRSRKNSIKFINCDVTTATTFVLSLLAHTFPREMPFSVFCRENACLPLCGIALVVYPDKHSIGAEEIAEIVTAALTLASFVFDGDASKVAWIGMP